MNRVYVYGTLRPGNTPVVKVKGNLYDLGWYPGIELGGTGDVTCEVIEVDDKELARIDGYEGYYSDDHPNSLYLRVNYGDGWIYIYNRDVSGRTLVEGGDWLAYKEQKRGLAA